MGKKNPKKPKKGAAPPKQKDSILQPFRLIGTDEGSVPVELNYDIIRQFSQQLYTNPRKAIEELVCNSYDAGATECYVRTPKTEKDALLVLDNGHSMDFAGLKQLWRVASSPKADAKGERIAHGRKQIGKFGVGKLAAFALGRRLTHIATKAGVTRIITVSQERIKESKGSAPTFDVIRVLEKDARKVVEPLLDGLPVPWAAGWEHWTLAIVGDVDDKNLEENLKIGILERMIRTALPTAPDFKVALNGDFVELRELKQDDIEIEVPMTDDALIKKIERDLRDFWAERLAPEGADPDPEKVPSAYYAISKTKIEDPKNVNQKIPAIEVPRLGGIAGRGVIAKESLTGKKVETRGYHDNGFIVRVRGKQINQESPLWGISARSHSAWARFRAEVEIPELDKVLLVQRNDVSSADERPDVAREVLKTLFNHCRVLAEDAEAEGAPQIPNFASRLRTQSPDITMVALQHLTGGQMPPGGLASIKLDFATGPADGPAVTYDKEEHAFVVNLEHPIIRNLDDLQVKNVADLRKVLGEASASTLLAEAYLHAKNVDGDVVEAVADLLDDGLRVAAGSLRDAIKEQIEHIEEASRVGGKTFECAVARAFRILNITARRHGKADEADGIIEIPRPGKNLKISIEAKGSEGVVDHTELRESSVSRHRKDAGCTWAVAVARQFQTDGIGGKESALLREVKDKEVSLLTTEAIGHILTLHGKRPWTYPEIERILTTQKQPNELIAFIDEVWTSRPQTTVLRDVLAAAHETMEKNETDLTPGVIVAHPKVKKHGLSEPDLWNLIVLCSRTTKSVVIIDETWHRFRLEAPVQTILQEMQAGDEQ